MRTAARQNEDFGLWCAERLAALGAEVGLAADLSGLAVEIDAMVSRDYRAFEGHLTVVLRGLLLWGRHGGQDRLVAKVALTRSRQAVADILEHGPSLRLQLSETLTRLYPFAVRLAALAEHVEEDAFPELCPWTVDQVLDFGFLPVA